MSAHASPTIADSYRKNGFYFPFDVMSPDEAAASRSRLEALEQRHSGFSFGNKGQLNQAHILFRFAYDIVVNPTILDAVESIIGPDILVWGSTYFIKEPQSHSFISWHQDLKYWGLDDDALVSCWVAISPVTRANGCMRFVPGSHKMGLLDHKDTFDDKNALTRGQEADIEIDESDTAYAELKPGQASFHHGKLLHASSPNYTDDRRIGLTINYMAPHMRQVVADTDFAMLVRGKDPYGHFEQVPPPQSDMSEEAVAWHNRVIAAQNGALYDGSAKTTGIATV
jgi:chlorinating enzyme